MGYRDYSDAGFAKPRVQHNIMALVGNGFDLQVARDYGMKVDTKYTSFYNFMKLRSFNTSNPILLEMEKLRDDGWQNWSDVEAAVEGMARRGRVSVYDLASSLKELQAEFSRFLDMAAPSDLQIRLGEASSKSSLAIGSLQGFLADLDKMDFDALRFKDHLDHYNIFNFYFVNFNYTTLLDNLLYLDQDQFDPHPHRWADRNFNFLTYSGSGIWGDPLSAYVVMDVVHPHGRQDIPRSLLFGVDGPASLEEFPAPSQRLAKPFWAQSDVRYRHLFQDTELFMVFGSSLGNSDAWWWRNIAECLGVERTRINGGKTFTPELILYWFNGAGLELTKEQVVQKFLEVAEVEGVEQIVGDIYVVLFDASTPRKWLNTLPD